MQVCGVGVGVSVSVGVSISANALAFAVVFVRCQCVTVPAACAVIVAPATPTSPPVLLPRPLLPYAPFPTRSIMENSRKSRTKMWEREREQGHGELVNMNHY